MSKKVAIVQSNYIPWKSYLDLLNLVDEFILFDSNVPMLIPISMERRLENPGIIPLQIIEVQSGVYVEEDDIERIDDEYERVKKK